MPLCSWTCCSQCHCYYSQSCYQKWCVSKK